MGMARERSARLWALGYVDRATKRLSAARRCNASIACLGYRLLRTVRLGRRAISRPLKNCIHPEVSFDRGATRERMIADIKQIHLHLYLQPSALVVRELISRYTGSKQWRSGFLRRFWFRDSSKEEDQAIASATMSAGEPFFLDAQLNGMGCGRANSAISAQRTNP
jgi:hypothetical protein